MRVKEFFVLIMWALYFIAQRFLQPIITNEMALRQLDNSAESFIAPQANFMAWEYAIPALVVITLIIYRKEIKQQSQKVKDKMEEK